VCSILEILLLALFGPAARKVRLGRYREIFCCKNLHGPGGVRTMVGVGRSTQGCQISN